MASRCDLGDLTYNNLGQFKALHKALFPVDYSDQFYDNALKAGEFAKLAYYNDVCVGVICCRQEVDESDSSKTKVYIMTLGVLEPYRRHGLGFRLVKHILEQAKSDSKISQIYLHVQISNETAAKFYQKLEFDIVSTEKDYYKNIEPRDALLLSKKVEH